MSDYFDVVDSKLREASKHLQTMGQVPIHPRHRPGFSGHHAAMLSSPDTMMVHDWHDAFNSALNAFLSATRSVPDVIRNRFGYDCPDKNPWLLKLDPDERTRRRRFGRRFEKQFERFGQLPLNEERNEAHHGSGVAHWEVVVRGSWGTYTGGPLRRLPQTEYRESDPGEDPPLGWLPGACTRELEVRWTDFWWVIPQDGAPPLRLPLFDELGWNTRGVSEVGLKRRADEEVFGCARRDGRILVTKDGDFLDNRRFPLQASPGVVILPDEPIESLAFAAAAACMLNLVGPWGELWQRSKMVVGHAGEVTVTSRDGGATRRTRFRFTKGPFAQIWTD
jgi:predicted nuclease of predicted toxin-antitoxin system